MENKKEGIVKYLGKGNKKEEEGFSFMLFDKKERKEKKECQI